jgi:hypothetical protein
MLQIESAVLLSENRRSTREQVQAVMGLPGRLLAVLRRGVYFLFRNARRALVGECIHESSATFFFARVSHKRVKVN